MFYDRDMCVPSHYHPAHHVPHSACLNPPSHPHPQATYSTVYPGLLSFLPRIAAYWGLGFSVSCLASLHTGVRPERNKRHLYKLQGRATTPSCNVGRGHRKLWVTGPPLRNKRTLPFVAPTVWSRNIAWGVSAWLWSWRTPSAEVTFISLGTGRDFHWRRCLLTKHNRLRCRQARI